MLTMGQKAQIRHMVLVAGKSRRQVARETGHSRNTVKKMLANAEVPRYEKKARRAAPLLGSYKELIATWVEECELEQQRILKGHKQSIGERLATEQEQLLPLPAPYPCCKTVVVKANKLSLVNFATNRYSIPVAHAHEALTLRAYVDRIEISNGTETIARHRRCWERNQDILQPQQPSCIQELLRRHHEEAQPSPLCLKGHPQLAAIQVSLPAVQQYDQLLPHWGGA